MSEDESKESREALLLAKCYSIILAWSFPKLQEITKPTTNDDLSAEGLAMVVEIWAEQPEDSEISP